MKRTLIHDRVEAAREGRNPTVICRMNSGWAVLGDFQFLRGYSLLLPDPVVPDLNRLDREQRIEFLHEMTVVGDALLEVTGAERINYEILGNTDPALHAHLFPRFPSEPDKLRVAPVWRYETAERRSVPFERDRDTSLMKAIEVAIRRSHDLPE